MSGFGDLFGGLGELFRGVAQAAEGGVEFGAEAAAVAGEGGSDGEDASEYTRYLAGGRRPLNINDI